MITAVAVLLVFGTIAAIAFYKSRRAKRVVMSSPYSPATPSAPAIQPQAARPREATKGGFRPSRPTSSGDPGRGVVGVLVRHKRPAEGRNGRMRCTAKSTPPAVDWVTGRRLR